MDPSLASYKRFWSPGFFQTLALSLFAGTVATAVTHPMDFLKTVIQFRSEGIGLRGYKVWDQGYNAWRIMRQMHSRGGGFLQFYGGFQANMMSRLSYLVVRNSLYKLIYDQVKPSKETNDLTINQKMVLSGLVGGIAAYVTAPLTTISIRAILDSQLKSEWRRNYTSTTQGIDLLKKQGSLWKGSWYNVLRHVVLNASLTGPYDLARQGLWFRFGDYYFVQPLALLFAAAVSSIVTLPFDNVRTRMMQAHPEPERNRFNYKGIADIVGKSVKYEGTPYAMWAGFTAYYISTVTYAALTIGITGAFTDSWKRKKGLDEWQI